MTGTAKVGINVSDTLEIKTVDDQVSLSAQVQPGHMGQLKARGVELLVCNRPDGEDAGQPSFAAIKAAAQRVGIEAVELSFTAGQMAPEIAPAFARLLSRRWRMHAYCRTGRRSLAAFAAARMLDPRITIEAIEELAAIATRLGFDGAELKTQLLKSLPKSEHTTQ